RDRQQLVNTSVPFGTALPNAAFPDLAQRALTTGERKITDLFMSPVVGQLAFGIVVPVQIGRESRYALVRSPDLSALAAVVAANEVPPGWHAVVSDAAHHIIAQSEQDTSIGKDLPPSQWHPAGPGGIFEFIDSEGQPSLEAYVWSELTGWETAVWAPKALLEAPV